MSSVQHLSSGLSLFPLTSFSCYVLSRWIIPVSINKTAIIKPHKKGINLYEQAEQTDANSEMKKASINLLSTLQESETHAVLSK